MMYNKLLNLNVINSNSLDDVKYYMSKSLLPSREQIGNREFEFFGLGEQENLDKWKFPNFNYIINQYGFRQDMTSTNFDIGAFGCSYTFGQGLPSHMLWHNLLGQALNKTVGNFGMPGASIETVVDLFCIVSKHVKLTSAVFLLPHHERIQVAKINDNHELGILNCLPNNRGGFNQSYGIEDKDILSVIPEDENVKVLKNSIYLAQDIAQRRGITLFISTWNYQTYCCLREMDLVNVILLPCWFSAQDLIQDFARDYRHPGPGHHSFFADRILPVIKLYI